ncbi:SMEK domain-containing protein [Arthrobacter sp. MW3 TE3886]|uniref:SMEK domain-containing protein n=1 Tax=Arthrobacter sp. MW3 TE3886 TaxID=3156254 RepID=UPI00351435D5
MTQKLVSSGAPTPGDYHRSILRLLGLAGEQMSAQSREGAYVSSELERLGCELLNISRGLDLNNENCFKTNTPAVDLLTRDRSLGVQITLELNISKVKKTLKKFGELTVPGGSLHGTQKLWILGLRLEPRTDPPTWKNTDPHNVVFGSFRSQLMLESLDSSKLERIERSLLQITGCQMTSEPSEQESLERIIEFMDRPAVYQYSKDEISWTKCMSALDAVALLINSGVKLDDGMNTAPVTGWTRPLPTLNPMLRTDLKTILKQVNAVKIAINRADPRSAMLDQHQSQFIDTERAKLRTIVNAFAKKHRIQPPFPMTRFVE